MGAHSKPNHHSMSAVTTLPQDDLFLHEVAKLADKGLKFQQMMQVHEEALDAESILFDGVDAQHASDCRLKSELTSALDDFVQGARRLKQAHLSSHVKQTLLARHSHKEQEQRCPQTSLDNILDSIFVDSFAAA